VGSLADLFIRSNVQAIFPFCKSIWRLCFAPSKGIPWPKDIKMELYSKRLWTIPCWPWSSASL